MRKLVSKLGKDTAIISSDNISPIYKTFDKNNQIKEGVDSSHVNFETFDLFIALDVNDLKRFGIKFALPRNMRVINIDHHGNNVIKTKYKISETSYCATAEMLLYLSEDWKLKIDKEDARLILAGILTDSDSFSYSASERVFQSVIHLMEEGADYDEVQSFISRNNSIDQLLFWSKMLANVKIDEEGKFAYSALKYEEYENLKDLVKPKRTVADMFIRTIKDTNFGIVMVEDRKKNLTVSVRSRLKGFGVIDLIKDLGGGGHFDGGGAVIRDLPFDDAVEKVLQVARKYGKKR